MQKSKRGQSQVNLAIAIGIGLFVVGGIVIGLAGFRDSQTSTTVAYGVLNQTLNMFDNLSDQLPTVGTILGVAILIGVILGSFVVGRAVVNRL